MTSAGENVLFPSVFCDYGDAYFLSPLMLCHYCVIIISIPISHFSLLLFIYLERYSR